MNGRWGSGQRQIHLGGCRPGPEEGRDFTVPANPTVHSYLKAPVSFHNRVCNRDSELRLWSQTTRIQTPTLHFGRVICVCFLICKMGMIVIFLYRLVRIQWADSYEPENSAWHVLSAPKIWAITIHLFLKKKKRKEMWKDRKISIRGDFSCPSWHPHSFWVRYCSLPYSI